MNDYNFLWGAGKTEDEVRSHVPKVVKHIVRTVEVFIYFFGLSVSFIFAYCVYLYLLSLL